jgi:hypothetical protein
MAGKNCFQGVKFKKAHGFIKIKYNMVLVEKGNNADFVL